MNSNNTIIDGSPVRWTDIEPNWKGTNDICGYIKNGMIYFYGSVARLLWQKNGLHASRQMPTQDRQNAYFMRAENGLIKIGKSIDVKTRLSQLQTLSPIGIRLIDTPLCTATEAELHHRFAHLRDHGEWFKPDKELLDFIAMVRGDQDAV